MPKAKKAGKAQKAKKERKKGKGEGKEGDRVLRKGVTKRLRALLATGPHTIPNMRSALTVDEDAILYGLRRLGKSKKGTLRSGMVAGKACWWWETEREA